MVGATVSCVVLSERDMSSVTSENVQHLVLFSSEVKDKVHRLEVAGVRNVKVQITQADHGVLRAFIKGEL